MQKGIFSAKIRINIFFPVKQNSSMLLQELVNNLNNSFGGVTVLDESDGYWLSSNGTLMRDRINIIFVDVNLSEPEVQEFVKNLALKYQKELEEEVFYITVNPVYISLAS